MTTVPPGRAARPEAASSVGPIVNNYWPSLRPCLGTIIAPGRRANSVKHSYSSSANSGRTYSSNVARSQLATVVGVSAVTDAVRGTSIASATSPK